jgi:hypothetical protein
VADNARKSVLDALLDTWSRGPSLLPLLTNLGPVVRGGDSVDVPSIGSLTVNTSESGAVASTSLSVDTLTVNRPKFINQGVTMQQMAQLLNGNNAFTAQLTRAAGGQLINAIERDIVEHLIASTGAGLTARYHANVAGDAITDDDINEAEAIMLEQDGVIGGQGNLAWLVSPRAAMGIKNAAQFSYDSAAPQGSVGLPLLGQINGIPVYTHSALPGAVEATRYSVATSAVSISTNVATATVASGHGFVPGQLIYTTGLTTNVAVGSPAVISSVTATTIVYPLTAGDGALADGIGTIYSASSYAMLVHRPWVFYAMDGEIPFVEVVKREANAGYSLQLYQHMGRAMKMPTSASPTLPSACVILHGLD